MVFMDSFPVQNMFPNSDDLRYLFGGMVARDGNNAVRSGIFPPVADNLLTSTATMVVNVGAFRGVVNRDSGAVFFANNGILPVTIDAAPTSNSRLDVIYAQVNDSSSFVTAPDPTTITQLEVLKGTAAATPVRNPAGLPPGAIELGTVQIPSTAVSMQSPNVIITPTFPYTCMAGGILRFRNVAEMSGVTANIGQLAIDDSGNIYRWNTSWLPILTEWTSWTSTWGANAGATILGNSTFTARYRYIGRKTIALRTFLSLGSSFDGGRGDYFFTLPPGITGHAQGEQFLTGKVYLPGFANFPAYGMVPANGNYIAPFAPANTGTSVYETVRNTDAGGGTGQGRPLVPGQYSFFPGANIGLEGILEIN